MQLYSIINGDIIGSTKLSDDRRDVYLRELKRLFDELKKKKKELGVVQSFEIYRGDSFQGALDKPEKSLKVILLLRSFSRMVAQDYFKKKRNAPIHRTSFNAVTDIRIAVGIGKISKLEKRLLESDGEAFHRSGRLIDSMKKTGQNIAIETPWKDKDKYLDSFCGLLDAVISRWSPLQAEVVHLRLKGQNQTQIAGTLKTSISAVNQKLKTANWSAVEKLLILFETIITEEK